LLELRALERVDLVTDENGNGHDVSLEPAKVWNCAILVACQALMLRPRSYYRALSDADGSARIEP